MGKKNKGKPRGFGVHTVYKFARLGAFLAPTAAIMLGPEDGMTKAKSWMRAHTGFNMDTGTFNWSDALTGWLPGLATTVITYGIQKIGGIIRRL